MDKQNVVYPYKRIILSNRNKLLILSAKWMNFKIFMLSERGWTQNSTYHMVPFSIYTKL